MTCKARAQCEQRRARSSNAVKSGVNKEGEVISEPNPEFPERGSNASGLVADMSRQHCGVV